MLDTPEERIEYAFQRISDALGFTDSCGEGGVTLALYERTIVYSNPGYGRIVIRPEDKYAMVYPTWPSDVGLSGMESHMDLIDAAMDGFLWKWSALDLCGRHFGSSEVAAMNASTDEFPPILI